MTNFKSILDRTNESFINWTKLDDNFTSSFLVDYESYNNFSALFFTNEFHSINFENSFISMDPPFIYVLLDESFYSGKDGSEKSGLALYLAKSKDKISPIQATQAELAELLKTIKSI